MQSAPVLCCILTVTRSGDFKLLKSSRSYETLRTFRSKPRTLKCFRTRNFGFWHVSPSEILIRIWNYCIWHLTIYHYKKYELRSTSPLKKPLAAAADGPSAGLAVGMPLAAGVVGRPGAAAGALVTVADGPSLLVNIVRAMPPENLNKQPTRQYGKRVGKLETRVTYKQKTQFQAYNTLRQFAQAFSEVSALIKTMPNRGKAKVEVSLNLASNWLRYTFSLKERQIQRNKQSRIVQHLCPA